MGGQETTAAQAAATSGPGRRPVPGSRSPGRRRRL